MIMMYLKYMVFFYSKMIINQLQLQLGIFLTFFLENNQFFTNMTSIRLLFAINSN